jgi:rod shape-determining protein MreD
MIARQRNGWGVIILSFGAALALTATPLPSWARPFRPDFVALLVIYWCHVAPARVGVGVAWMVGLLVDAFQFTLLGQNALSKCLLAYATGWLGPRLVGQSRWQQSFLVFALLCLDIAVIILIRHYLEQVALSLDHVLGAFTGMLLWPILFWVMRAPRAHPVLR